MGAKRFTHWMRSTAIALVVVIVASLSISVVELVGQSNVASATTTAVPSVSVSGNELVNAAGQPVRLLGVNVTFTDASCVQGYGFPDPGTTAWAIASWDVNSVRVLLNEDCWLGINGVSSEYSGAAYQAAVEQFVTALNKAGILAILDLQFSAPGNFEATGQWAMPDADHSVTFWSQVASAFASNPSVIFDLFNEPSLGGTHPSGADWACWLNGCTSTADRTATGGATTSGITYTVAGVQQLLDAVRAAGATQPVMVGGLNWAGDPCGIADEGGNGGSCTWLTYEPVDPLHQLVASFHTYNWTSCKTLSCWNADLAPLAAIAPVVTGEFGEADCSTNYISQYITWADQHGISYLATSWQTPSVGATSCTASMGGSDPGNNLDLISNWTGAPSTIDPQGSWVHAHLMSEDVGSVDGAQYIGPPIVTSISPSSGSALGGTKVTITGTNFTGATAVHFGGVAVSFTVVSATQITAVAPALPAGTHGISVTTADGSSRGLQRRSVHCYGPHHHVDQPELRARLWGAPRSPSPGPTSPGRPPSTSAAWR